MTSRDIISDNICKSFYSDDLEKAKALVGEIRNWGGIDYKKISDGEWVKITQTKKGISERAVAQSGIKKVISSELGKHFDEYQKVVKEFEEKWKKENGSDLWRIQLKVKLSRDQSNDENVKAAYEKYRDIANDLQDELKDVNNLAEIKAKQARETASGKKEISPEDEYFKSNFDAFHQIFRKIDELPKYVTAKEALGEKVSADDYWLNTNALFKKVYEYNSKDAVDNPTGEWIDPVDKLWQEMKSSGKYEHTFSPKSSSEYLVDRKTGNVYRKADHWGKCASCYWATNMEHKYGIGVCNVEDFERNDGSGYGNKQRINAVISGSDVILSKLKSMLTDESVYFDKKSMERIKNISQKIESDLKWEAYVNDEELNKIKQQYKEIFNTNV